MNNIASQYPTNPHAYENAIAFTFQVISPPIQLIEKLYADPDDLDRFVPQYCAKKILESLILLHPNNPTIHPQTYIAQTLRVFSSLPSFSTKFTPFQPPKI